MTTTHRPLRSGPALTDVRLSPAAVVLCCSAVVVGTGFVLGASWLARPLLGLPVGLWLIAAVYAAWRRGWLDLLEASIPLPVTPAGAKLNLSPLTQRRLAPALRLGVAARAVVADLTVAAWNFEPRSPDQLREAVACALDRRPELAAPLRIGIAAPVDMTRSITTHEAAVPVCWRALDEGRSSSASAARLDLVFRHDGMRGGVANIPERDRRPATWFDWSTPRPLSFASVFPHHVDPAQLTITLLPGADAHDPLVTSMLVAAAAQARFPARLTLSDRFFGRMPLDGEEDPSHIDPGAFRVRAMRRIAQTLSARDPTDASTLERTAASVVCAWLVTPGARVPMAERRSLLEAVAPFVRNRPETWLRLAAVRFANYDDDAAIQALLEADPLVRSSTDQIVVDQAGFVQSEISLGGSGPLTLGRIAAGICLLAAQHPYERLEFLRDDLLEDLRYSGWLLGRDQDSVMLHRVIRELTRIRRAESRGLPGTISLHLITTDAA
ncbi:MAG: hypothetical protein DYG94_02040 [Leptolyngbya sp. PLA3]|nr:MAG: hypothetical protein EDM82_02515 [Cyanobacteria bacterium CYA]MCE7967512.1 hypothetical protein [Leptolyngbya sp. PL-A3]